ncbi:MAG: peptidoglycan DD-metalloendopeptidase family protein [Candidatus Paceibacteria bacterium]
MGQYNKTIATCLFFILVFLFGTGFLFYSKTGANKVKRERVRTDKKIQTTQKNNQTKPKINRAEKYVVKSGDVFADVAEKFDIERKKMMKMVSSSKSVYNLTDLSIGQPFYLLKKGGSFFGLEYEIDSENKIVVTKENNKFQAQKRPIEYNTKIDTVQGTISSSLFKAGREAGMSDGLILDLAEIFAWSVDFAVETKSGDQFKLIYEKRYREGQEAKHGDILAAKVTNKGQEYTAFLFENKDGEARYYNKNGESLRRQFLKAPLRYDRISSGFTNARFHPTLGRGMPHRAIDYAAARGTPIRAVGDGHITYAGWKKGYGIYIDIRHNGTYQTQYAHLSQLAQGIRPGAEVKQGEIIGFVGSTGFSTGPHLHYQIKKYGKKVNPLEVELPKGEPVPESKKDEFEQVKNKFIDRLKL